VTESEDHEKRTAELLDELGEGHAEGLLHLMNCQACQGTARDRLRGESEEARRTAEPAYDRLLAKLEERTPGLLREMEEQSAEARRLLVELLDSTADQRSALAGGPGYRNLKLAELLLQESWSLQPAELELSQERARLAFRIAAQRHPVECAGRVDDIKARACVLVGNARRLAGDRLAAEEHFRRAVSYLTCAPGAIERAFYCQMLSALRLDQRQDDEAAGLLWRAAVLYNENADLLEEAACLAELGFLFVADDQVHRAVKPLTRACETLELYRDATLAVQARLALAVCHARLGHSAKALDVLRSARAMYDRVDGSSEQMAQVAWMEGKVAALTGNREDAPSLLDTARKSFLRAGKLYDTVFASLDLAAALAKSTRLESIHPLIHDVVEAFPADVEQAGALRVLGRVEAALLGGKRAEMEDVVASSAEMLRRYRRNPLLVFEGLPRTPFSPAAVHFEPSGPKDPGPITEMDKLF
jgi:tetratricopeptide (TPR) repeat protein